MTFLCFHNACASGMVRSALALYINVSNLRVVQVYDMRCCRVAVKLLRIHLALTGWCALHVSSVSIIFTHAHEAQRGKVIGSVVVVVVSTKITRSRSLGKFASANCSYVSETKRKCVYVRRGCPNRTTKAINRVILFVTPISHTHSKYLHIHALRSRTCMLAIDQYSQVV